MNTINFELIDFVVTAIKENNNQGITRRELEKLGKFSYPQIMRTTRKLKKEGKIFDVDLGQMQYLIFSTAEAANKYSKQLAIRKKTSSDIVIKKSPAKAQWKESQETIIPDDVVIQQCPSSPVFGAAARLGLRP